MRFKVDPADLMKSLSLSGLVVSTRSPLIESRCVRLRVENGVLYQTVCSSNAFISHHMDVRESKDGEVAVDFEMLVADVASLRSEVSVRTTPHNLFLEAGRSKRKRRLIPLDDFPDEPVVAGESFEVPSQQLAHIINLVSFAALSDASRIELQCVRIANGMVMGGDGQRISSHTLDTNMTVSIPMPVLDGLSSVLGYSDTSKWVLGSWISVENNVCRFKFSGLVDEYPDAATETIAALKGTPPIAKFVVDRGVAIVIMGSLRVYTERARRLGIEYATLDTSKGYLRVSTNVEDVGSFEDELVCKDSQGGLGDKKILFHPPVLLEALNHLSGEYFVLNMYGTTQPLMLLDPDNDEWSLVQSVMATREMIQEVEEDDF